MSRLFVGKKQREKYELKNKENFQPLEESSASPVHSVHSTVHLGVNGTNSSYGSITSLLNNEVSNFKRQYTHNCNEVSNFKRQYTHNCE